MKRLNRFFLLLVSILFLMGMVPVFVDGGFESFRLRPVLLTIVFMAIVVAAQVFVFEQQDHKGFWQRIAVAGVVVFFAVAGFSLAINAILFDRITLWIAVSQGLVCNVFLLASILVVALINKKASIRRSETPLTYLKKSVIAALATFGLFAVMSSDQFLLHGMTLEIFLGQLRILAVFASFNGLLAGGLLYILSAKAFWASRPWLMALVVPMIMTMANCIVFSRYLGFASPKIIGVFLVCSMITLLILALLIHRQKNLKISRMSFDFARKEAQYMELKQQVDPHFLFNNLNTMISFIETQPGKAISFGHHLSNVYRHFLTGHREEFVPLEDEMQFLHEYIEIFRAKFGPGFIVEFQLFDSSGLYVLSLAVRELADNFFKHNPADPAHPPILRIVRDGEFLRFENTHLSSGSQGCGTGLGNIAKRYKILTGLDLEISKGETFAVKLPLLRL